MVLLLGAVGLVIAIQGHMQPAAASLPSPTAVPISFKLLSRTRCGGTESPVYPDELRACEGRIVTISGFATPYDDPQHPAKMLLTQTGSGCFFCAPPDARGVVLIRCSSNEVPVLWGTNAVTFEGTLHLVRPDSTDEEAKRFLFAIDGATLVRNQS